MLLVLPEIESLRYRYAIITGTFTIIRMKAIKLTTEKIPTTIYSWARAEIVNVTNIQISLDSFLRLHG